MIRNIAHKSEVYTSTPLLYNKCIVLELHCACKKTMVKSSLAKLMCYVVIVSQVCGYIV